MPDNYVLKELTAKYGGQTWSLLRPLSALRLGGGQPKPVFARGPYDDRPVATWKAPPMDEALAERFWRHERLRAKAAKAGRADLAKKHREAMRLIIEAAELPTRRAKVGIAPKGPKVEPLPAGQRMDPGTVLRVDCFEVRNRKRFVRFRLVKQLPRGLKGTVVADERWEAEYEGDPGDWLEELRQVPFASAKPSARPARVTAAAADLDAWQERRRAKVLAKHNERTAARQAKAERADNDARAAKSAAAYADRRYQAADEAWGARHEALLEMRWDEGRVLAEALRGAQKVKALRKAKKVDPGIINYHDRLERVLKTILKEAVWSEAEFVAALQRELGSKEDPSPSRRSPTALVELVMRWMASRPKRT